MDVNGRVAWVTGGSSGIGAAVARELASRGARVAVTARREEKLDVVARDAPGDVIAYPGDVRDREAMLAVGRSIELQLGPLDLAVLNAGTWKQMDVRQWDSTPIREHIDTNLLGTVNCLDAVLPGMIERKHGNILFTASMASLFGIPLVIAYAAAKTAMIGVVRTLTTELSPHGIRVNAIAPGWIETEMSRKAMEGDPVRKNKVIGRTPMAKFGVPSDVGWAAVYLASPAAKFVTGTIMPVDGGASIGF